MSNLGMPVMLHMLSGNQDSVSAWSSAVNKVIKSLELKDNSFVFVMDDGTSIALFDDGQSCCENRYMTTNDDLTGFVGSTLLSAETRYAPNVEDEYGEHEVQFLLVTTSIGVITLETHNEHNGYYGGFAVCAKSLN